MAIKTVILVSVVLGCSMTNGRPQGEITENEISPINEEEPIDFDAAYKQFFRIKDIIDRISLKNFKGILDDKPAPKEAPPPEDVSVVEAATEAAPKAATETAVSATTEPATEVVTEAAIEATTKAAIEEETEAVTKGAVEVSTEATTEAAEVVPRIVNEAEDVIVDESEETFFVSDDTAAAVKKYGYKILLKKVNGTTVPVGKINIQFPTVVEIVHQEEEETTAASAAEKTTAAAIAAAEETTSVVEVVDVVQTRDELIEDSVPIVEQIPETDLTTTIPDDAVTAIIPDAVDVSVESIADGVVKIAENAEMAIDSIKERSDTNIVPDGLFPGCAPTNAEIEEMLVILTKNVQKSAPVLKELLYVAKSLKGETDPEILSRNGAKLLRLLEPFLESLVPPQVAGCASSSTSSVMMSLLAVGSRMDDIALNEVSNDKADALREAATNLQLAGWVLGQLQDTVNTFYSEEGRCATNTSDTSSILKTLAEAMEGYGPIVQMLGNAEVVQDLEDTVDAITRAAEIITGLEDDTGAALPGVACGASFKEMAEALDNLANFIGALSIRV